MGYGATPLGWMLTPGLTWSSFVNNFYRPIAQTRPHVGYYALAELQEVLGGQNVEVITIMWMGSIKRQAVVASTRCTARFTSSAVAPVPHQSMSQMYYRSA